MRRTTGQDFTLIELMIVIAIVGILAAVALPAYQDYTIRAKVTEGLALAADAKVQIATGSSTLLALNNTATTWNAQAGGVGATSKYVTSVQIAPATGIVTIVLSAGNIGTIPAGSSLVLSPYVRSGAATTQLGGSYALALTGNLDWGCASASNALAAARGLATPVGTLPARYAPGECR